MARYTGPVCRLCRREGQTLHLRGKCALENRSPGPPGEDQGWRRRQSEYGRQLREKQLVKRVYGVLEAQFRNTFEEAEQKQGITGEILLRLLERRLDNVITRMGLAWSRRQARQYINHEHVKVNGEIISVPSYRIEEGDEVSLRDRMKDNDQVIKTMSLTKQSGLAEWMTHTGDASGTVDRFPERSEIDDVDIEEQLIVELYSK
jgi:small subunit ribosomal protein S4